MSTHLHVCTRAGDLIYAGLSQGFRGEAFGGPQPCPPGASLAQLAAGVQALLDVMVAQGYALNAAVTDVVEQPRSSGGSGSFRISIQGPCNLWGLRALGARRSLVINAYSAMVVDAFLRASGRPGVVEVELTDAGVEERWRVA